MLKNEATTKGATEMTDQHLHDFDISIEVAEVPLHLMAAVRAELEAKMQAIVDDWMKETEVSDFERDEIIEARIRPHLSTIHDGRYSCTCPKMGRRVG